MRSDDTRRIIAKLDYAFIQDRNYAKAARVLSPLLIPPSNQKRYFKKHSSTATNKLYVNGEKSINSKQYANNYYLLLTDGRDD